MSGMYRADYEGWCLEMLGLVDVGSHNFFVRWFYTLYFNRIVLPKFNTQEDLKIRKFQAFYSKVMLHDKKNSTRYVYLILFYVRTASTSYVFWNVSPTIWPFDVEHDWTFRHRKQREEIISVITEVVRYARESTDSEFFNRLKYVQRKSKRLRLLPLRFLRACNEFF